VAESNSVTVTVIHVITTVITFGYCHRNYRNSIHSVIRNSTLISF